jgi:general secretion pathway protein F
VEKPALQNLLDSVYQDVKQGLTLSSSLAKFSVFDALYIGLLRIAEETGELATTFERLAFELKYQLELANKVKQALIYPSVILAVCVLALVFIFNFVVPNLTSLFSAQDDLPLYTVALLNVSQFMQDFQLYLLVLLLGAGFLLYQQRNSAWVERLVDTMRDRLPVVSSANLLVERIRFNAALATMLSSGVAIDRALKLAQGTLRSKSLRHEVGVACESVQRGEGLAQSMSETRIYPPYYASLLSIGEESGKLERVFTEIADRSRTDFYNWVTRFTTLLEPILILVMGTIVGTVVVIMMLSISAITSVDL